jgi:hypothetical protein
MSNKPIVSIEFLFNGAQKGGINIMEPPVLDMNQVSAEARVSNTMFEYSGRHDHGNLPELKTSGNCAEVVSAIQEAKKECDSFLTQQINEFYGYSNGCEEIGVVGEEGEEVLESKAKKLCVENNSKNSV